MFAMILCKDLSAIFKRNLSEYQNIYIRLQYYKRVEKTKKKTLKDRLSFYKHTQYRLKDYCPISINLE